jgi:hypothetical protein
MRCFLALPAQSWAQTRGCRSGYGQASCYPRSTLCPVTDAARSEYTMPSPGGQASGMAGHRNRCGLDWAGRCGIRRPPMGYHTTAQGQSHMTHAPVRRGLPLDRRAVGLRQADGMPHEPQRARSVTVLPR